MKNGLASSVLASAPARSGRATGARRPPVARLSSAHSSAFGQPAMPGRTRLPATAGLAVLALLSLNLFVNVTTQLDDARRRGVALPLALPLTLEITSAAAATLSAFIVFAAVRLFPPDRGRLWRTLPAHLGASLLFSAT